MTATIDISLDEFHRAAEQAVRHSERTYHQFINGQGLAVASRAIKDTEKADPSKIAYILAGNVRTKISTSRKTGLRSTRRQYDVAETSLAARIVNARLVASGEKPIWGKELVKVAKRMVGARMRASRFIGSGWIYSIRTLAAAVGYSAGRSESARMTGEAKGYARPARVAISSVVTCEIGNTALLQDKRTPMPVAQKGLAAALSFVAKDMLDHLAKKLQPVFNEVNAK